MCKRNTPKEKRIEFVDNILPYIRKGWLLKEIADTYEISTPKLKTWMVHYFKEFPELEKEIRDQIRLNYSKYSSIRTKEIKRVENEESTKEKLEILDTMEEYFDAGMPFYKAVITFHEEYYYVGYENIKYICGKFIRQIDKDRYNQLKKKIHHNKFAGGRRR